MRDSSEADRQKKIGEALRKYKLPSRGKYPFIPPKGWHPSMPLWPGGGQGFIDVKGDRWQQGRSITAGQPFEWDVQLSNDKHLNVDLEGNISHGLGKDSRTMPSGKKKKKQKRVRKK